MAGYYGNILCVSRADMLTAMSEGMYNYMVRTRKVTTVVRAARDREAQYSLESLPEKYRVKMYGTLPQLNDEQWRREAIEQSGAILRNVCADAQARVFFENYLTPTGDRLRQGKIEELYSNAIVLNALRRVWHTSYAQHCKTGHRGSMISVTDFWKRAAEALPRVADAYPINLPANPRSLQRKYEAYQKGGYEALVKKSYGLQNRCRISKEMERLFLSIYGSKDKPFLTKVLKIYDDFMEGRSDIVDIETGELYDRADFMRDGEPIRVSEAALWKLINKPENRRIVDARRNDASYNRKTYEPHHIRRSPDYSLSKVSMDDKDLTRKTKAGETVCAYYSYDVKSGAVIGAAWSKKKDMDLVYECFRDMFRTCMSHGLAMPMELEVEHHLMNQIEGDLRRMFPFVHFCAAGNSQEKRAEHFNRAKKYTADAATIGHQGRWWARGEAYLTPSERISGEHNGYKEQTAEYRRLIADEKEAIHTYNHSLHPDQRKYPGMTRWQVLMEFQNPQARKLDTASIFRYVGECTKTTLRRSQYVQVQYRRYRLPDPQCVARFKANNYECEAYYIRNAAGEIESVQLYQGERWIAECGLMEAYNEAQAERTERDDAVRFEQDKYVARYRKMVRDGRDGKLNRLRIVEALGDECAGEEPALAANHPHLPPLSSLQQEEPDPFADGETPEDIIARARARQ